MHRPTGETGSRPRLLCRPGEARARAPKESNARLCIRYSHAPHRSHSPWHAEAPLDEKAACRMAPPAGVRAGVNLCTTCDRAEARHISPKPHKSLRHASSRARSEGPKARTSNVSHATPHGSTCCLCTGMPHAHVSVHKRRLMPGTWASIRSTEFRAAAARPCSTSERCRLRAGIRTTARRTKLRSPDSDETPDEDLLAMRPEEFTRRFRRTRTLPNGSRAIVQKCSQVAPGNWIKP